MVVRPNFGGEALLKAIPQNPQTGKVRIFIVPPYGRYLGLTFGSGHTVRSGASLFRTAQPSSPAADVRETASNLPRRQPP